VALPNRSLHGSVAPFPVAYEGYSSFPLPSNCQRLEGSSVTIVGVIASGKGEQHCEIYSHPNPIGGGGGIARPCHVTGLSYLVPGSAGWGLGSTTW